jgi:hypothetical protein
MAGQAKDESLSTLRLLDADYADFSEIQEIGSLGSLEIMGSPEVQK